MPAPPAECPLHPAKRSCSRSPSGRTPDPQTGAASSLWIRRRSSPRPENARSQRWALAALRSWSLAFRPLVLRGIARPPDARRIAIAFRGLKSPATPVRPSGRIRARTRSGDWSPQQRPYARTGEFERGPAPGTEVPGNARVPARANSSADLLPGLKSPATPVRPYGRIRARTRAVVTRNPDTDPGTRVAGGRFAIGMGLRYDSSPLCVRGKCGSSWRGAREAEGTGLLNRRTP